VEAPITSTRFGPLPLVWPAAWVTLIWSSTLCSQPTGWAVMQMNPRTLGLMITAMAPAAVRQFAILTKLGGHALP